MSQKHMQTYTDTDIFKNTNISSHLLAANCNVLPVGGEWGPRSIINPRLEK